MATGMSAEGGQGAQELEQGLKVDLETRRGADGGPESHADRRGDEPAEHHALDGSRQVRRQRPSIETPQQRGPGPVGSRQEHRRDEAVVGHHLPEPDEAGRDEEARRQPSETS